MDDPVLMSRLAALSNNLNVVKEKLTLKAWEPADNLPADRRAELRAAMRAELQAEPLWIGLEITLVREIEKQLRTLAKVESDLDKAPANDQAALSAAWVRYGIILRDSQSVLRECLEIIGTLAIRDKNLDVGVLYVADELTRDCLILSTGADDYYLLVQSTEDAFSKTKARIIRLRFPEWTLWDLPLIGHELGHVVLGDQLSQESKQDFDDDLEVLRPFLRDQCDSLLGQDAKLKEKHQEGGEQAAEAERWAQGRVLELLADAFATYTLGPAYACSAIMLRLNPSTEAGSDRPSDIQREQVVLSMLRWVNARAPNPRPYTDVIETLERNWESAVDRANPNGKLSDADRARLAQLAEGFGIAQEGFLRKTALYPYRDPNHGWLRAQEWANNWQDQWNNTQPLTRPANQTGKLRDVLNATWMARLEIKGDGEVKRRACAALAMQGQDLCTQIIMTQAGSGRAPTGLLAPRGGQA